MKMKNEKETNRNRERREKRKYRDEKHRKQASLMDLGYTCAKGKRSVASKGERIQ